MPTDYCIWKDCSYCWYFLPKLVDRCLSEQQSSSPAQIDPTGFEPESEGTTGKIVIVVVLHTKAV